jgi:hypothetical protein
MVVEERRGQISADGRGLTEGEMNRVLDKAREVHPEIRWMGTLIRHETQIALCGVSNGLVAHSTVGNGRSPQEAITEIRTELERLWSDN